MLSVDFNQISDIPEGAFIGLAKLERLYLNSNKLTEINDEMWEWLRSLKILSLRSNWIRILQDGAFKSITKLRWLYLNSNRLSDIR